MRNEAPADRPPALRAAGLLTRSRFVRAFPTGREVFIGAPAWALAMAISAWYALWLREHDATFHLQSILALYAFGGLLAWPVSLFAARYLAQHRRGETRFAAFLFCLVAGTIGVTAFLFAIDYRAFYAQWHAATGSRTWLFQALFTSLSAIYQFMVLGIRLYLPLGGVALVLASLWLARAEGRQQR